MARARDDVWIWLGLAFLVLSGRRTSTSSSTWQDRHPDMPGGPLPDVWVWPLPKLAAGAREPRITSGFGGWRSTPKPHEHVGVDVMYGRPVGLPKGTKLPLPDNGSRDFELPEGTQVLAAAAGKVRAVKRTKRGTHVLLDHGSRELQTFYQHLSTVYVAKGDVVAAGDPLGEAGFDPSGRDKIRHLHFELRRNGESVDPEPLMRDWMLVSG